MTDYYDIDVKCEGILKLEYNEELETQFINSMINKNVVLGKTDINSLIKSNIVKNILEKAYYEDNQLPYDRCFGKGGFDKGGGYDKSSFSRVCI